jgi:hypothetical protein
MKPGDLAFVVRGQGIEGKIALILEILQSKSGLFEEQCRCLIEGKIKMIPVCWVEAIDETR